MKSKKSPPHLQRKGGKWKQTDMQWTTKGPNNKRKHYHAYSEHRDSQPLYQNALQPRVLTEKILLAEEIQHVEGLAGVLRVLVRRPFELVGLGLGTRLGVIHSEVVDEQRHLGYHRV